MAEHGKAGEPMELQQEHNTPAKAQEYRWSQPFTIKHVTFKNRILRSSIGGKTAYYDGTVNNAWKNFETKFAQSDVAGIISATMSVNEKRWSPIEYPQLSHKKFVKPLQSFIKTIQACGCKYIIQLGDPGYHTQTSLFAQQEDALSASAGFDLLYGYGNRRTAMPTCTIKATIQKFVDAAKRAQDTNADGLEITASKGYLIHQFLNPGINKRRDEYGGSEDARLLFLQQIVHQVRDAVGKEFLVGLRLSAVDYNFLPLYTWRLPIVVPLRHYFIGNTLRETIYYSQKLQDKIDYLHITSGFGFINPKENPGKFPTRELRMFADATRHLSLKAKIRAMLLNTCPWLVGLLCNIGWTYKEGVNVEYAGAFKRLVELPIIANGGLQSRGLIERVLREGKCDMVSMARPLLANPDLIQQFKKHDTPENPCTFCNKCTAMTAMFPLGCYDLSRFQGVAEMEQQILDWSADPTL
jgi:2,4-dienoyl-CoA reductase-like NADH-dependent reductase (Old Yellow Enzyme family)